MLQPKDVFGWFGDDGVTFFAGVPDSLLKDFCAYVTAHAPSEQHVITSNEGGAIALAMGHHLATGGTALVYMQNSGLGNTVNPLTSLASAQVYGVPMLLVVGWRGEPGKHDEPQHKQMGAVTQAALDAIEVPYLVLSDEPVVARGQVRDSLAAIAAQSRPHALLIRKGTFAKYSVASSEPRYPMTREEAIAAIATGLPAAALVVSTTGKPSRELYEIREQRQQPHDSDMLVVGGMGHASQIALGVALGQPRREVYCFDGDGAVLMHMGGLASIGTLAPHNYRHVVLNNGAHDSVGGQPTVGFEVDLCAVAAACGYRSCVRVETAAELTAALNDFHHQPGPRLLEVRIRKGARANLGRPAMSPRELKQRFSKFAQQP